MAEKAEMTIDLLVVTSSFGSRSSAFLRVGLEGA
jgi:hypothetical protein